MILIADRDDLRREMLVDILGSQMGQIVVEVKALSELRKWLREQMPRLLVFEAELVGTAEQALSFVSQIRVRAEILQLPLVSITVNQDPEFAAQLLRAGCNDLLVLPLQDALVAARLANQLRLRRAWSQLKRQQALADSFDNLQPPENPASYSTALPHFTRPHHAQSLAAWLEAMTPNDHEYLLLLAALARTLWVGHQQGFLFKQLDPQNVTLLPDGEVCVMGLGPHSDFSTGGSAASGFPQDDRYVAPEQWVGGLVDVRTDVFLFGLVSYRVMVGEHAYHQEAGSVLNEDQRVAQIRLPRKVRPDLDYGIDAWLQRCLSAEPSQRYSDMEEVITCIDGLTRMLHGPELYPSEIFAEPVLTTQTRALVLQLLTAEDEAVPRLFAELLEQTEDALRSGSMPDAMHEILAEPDLSTQLLARFLNPETWTSLYALFHLLARETAVPPLVTQYRAETHSWNLVRIAQLIVICSRTHLQPLVSMGLTMDDVKASLLLAAFFEYGGADLGHHLLNWAKHPGYLTQKELLKQLALAGFTDPLARQAVVFLGQSSQHVTVREMARSLKP